MRLSRDDIEAIKDAHSIQSTLTDAGVAVRGTRAQCPFCKSSTKKVDYSISFTDRLFHCHRCNEGGDIIRLHSLLRGGSFRDAARSLGLTGNKPPQKRHVTLSQHATLRLWQLDQKWQDGDDVIFHTLASRINTIAAQERTGQIDAEEAKTERGWAEAQALTMREELDEWIERTQGQWRTLQ